MTITRARLLMLTLLAIAACSAPEGANRSTRCKEGGACPEGLTCYRGFCVLDDAPDTSSLDSGTDSFEELDGATDPSEASAPPSAAPRDASAGAAPADAATSGGPPLVSDASSAPPMSVSDASNSGAPVIEDASSGGPSVGGDAGGEASVVDAGSDASQPAPTADAGMMSSEAINNEVRLCLVLCSANQQLCVSCLRGIIQRHPEVCELEAPNATEAVLRRLCGVLCLPYCGGQ